MGTLLKLPSRIRSGAASLLPFCLPKVVASNKRRREDPKESSCNLQIQRLIKKDDMKCRLDEQRSLSFKESEFHAKTKVTSWILVGLSFLASFSKSVCVACLDGLVVFKCILTK